MLHKLSGVLAEFGSLRVHLISQSSNNLNLTFVVDEGVAASLVPHLHHLLIKAEAMRVEDAGIFGPSWGDYRTSSESSRQSSWWHWRRRELLRALAQSGHRNTSTISPRYALRSRRCAAR